ncbi:MAG: glycyl-radical enzyme activating protein [Candidatus Hodarchaeales archaeon]
MKNVEGYIFDIKKFAVHDGPGIRTTVFMKGCPLNCWWCHNPESQRKEPEKMFSSTGLYSMPVDDRYSLIGRKVTTRNVMLEIEKDIIFYDDSGGGVTFSGGEPLFQLDFLNSLLEECKTRGIHSALDTTGYSSPEALEKVDKFVDLYLFDLKIIDDEKHLKYTGVSNKNILKNLEYLDSLEKEIIIRFPVIPGITDSYKNIEQVRVLTNSMNSIKRIDLLPYNLLGVEKYRKLERNYLLKDLKPPADEKIAGIKEHLENTGIEIQIGG